MIPEKGEIWRPKDGRGFNPETAVHVTKVVTDPVGTWVSFHYLKKDYQGTQKKILASFMREFTYEF
ncbi:hypothetical protein NVP1170O_137 [Vibrio phage 1.170.O._10N.261.52.C3]|nr:hypothetical protein NVP1170O_137 [Vibrio phage 1.170.O._10N.261.52.C3]